jgi:Peptidase family M28
MKTRNFRRLIPAWRAVIWMLAATVLHAQTLEVDPHLAKLVEAIRGEVNGSEALDFVVRQHMTDRWANFAKFQETAGYLEATMRAIGLQHVELGSEPADGVTRYGYWTMPLAWDVKQAKLEVVEPSVPPEMRVLADYSQEPASLVMWSGSTPPGGVTAEVVELKPATLKRLEEIDVKGKMVLTDPPLALGQRGALKAALYRKGAGGMLTYATENSDLVNGHYWMNAWGDNGWGYTKSSSPLVGFSITPQQGEYLSRLLAQGSKVRVKAIAETSYYSGSYPYITGVIQGNDDGEEVLELGHAFELGAQDNSTGAASMLEAVATLERLIDTGKLPRPKRSIRILIMAEDYGSSAYVATHMEQMKRTIGAICLDTAAGHYDETGGFTFDLNPDVSRSYQDVLIMRAADAYYADIPRRFPRWAPYQARTDSYLSDPLIGIPTVAPVGSPGAVNVHHNSADTPDRVGQRSVRDLSAIIAGFLYSLASADEHDISWLALITLDRCYENAVRANAPYLARVAVTEKAGDLGMELSGGLAKINYNAERDREALLSLARLASPENRGRVQAELSHQLEDVRRFAGEQRDRLQRAADQRARELSATVPVRPVPPPRDPSLAEADGIIVRRKVFGPVTLDDLPFEQRQGYPGFGDEPAPLILLSWCDGKRTLAEVIRLTQLEYGPMRFDFVGYFKFLAKHGYVDLLPIAP